MKAPKARGVFLLAVLVLVLLSGLALAHINILTLSPISLSTVQTGCTGLTSPSAQVIFNPCGTKLTFKQQGNLNTYTGQGLEGCFNGTCPPVGSNWSDTSVFWPIGQAFSSWSSNANICGTGYGSTCAPVEYYQGAMPYGGSGSYGAAFSLGGTPSLVTQTGNCAGSSSSTDCFTYPVGNSTSPPSICPNGGCYNIIRTFTVYKTNATGTYQAQTTQTFWVYRFYFSLTIIMSPPSSSISVYCDTSHANNPCPTNCLSYVKFWPATACYDPTSDFINGVSNFASVANGNSQLTGSQLSLQMNIPTSVIQSNLDWYGFYDAAIASQGPQTAGCPVGTNCVTGLTGHTVLGIYKDALLTKGAFPSNQTQFSTWLPSYSLSQLQNILPSAVQSTVYVAVPLADIGSTFTVANSCSLSSIAGCFSSTPSLTMNIPITFDVVGSKTPLFSQLPWQPGNGGCICQSIVGRIQDGGSPFAFLGLYNPLGGALVCVTACSTTPGQSIASDTNSSGWFTLINVPIPSGGSQTVNLYAQATGYNPLQISASISITGPLVNVGTFTMYLTSPGTLCIVPPIPNFVPGSAPLFNGVCLPTWMVILLTVGGILILAMAVFLVVPSRRKVGIAARGVRIGV